METSTATGTHQPGARTFDCPWCGAISKIPSDHLGEHFTCPECKKATKLTDKNTSSLNPTEPPPDAPHLTGDRTFDCPWCGAICSVPSQHLGEHFTCPECKKATKLTPQNTRRADVFTPPPDAPPPEWEVARARRTKVLIAVGIAAAIGIAVAVSQGGGTPAKPAVHGDGTAQAPSPPSTPDEATPPPSPIPGGLPQPPDVGPPTPPPGLPTPPSPVPPGPTPPVPTLPGPTPIGPTPPQPTPPQPTPPQPTPPQPTPPQPTPPQPTPPVVPSAPDEDAVAKAEARVAAAGARLAATKVRLSDAKKRADDFRKDNPAAAQADETFRGLGAIWAERMRLLGGKDGATTPAEARAFDADLAKFIEQDALRVKAAEAALGWLRTDLSGRHAIGAASWKDVHFRGVGFERAAKTLLDTTRAEAAKLPADLAAGVAVAEKANEDARRELAEAEHALLQAKTGGN